MIEKLYDLKDCSVDYTCMEPVPKMSNRIPEKINKYITNNTNIKYTLVESNIPDVGNLPLNHQFDVILAAQSFHWFATKENLKVLNQLLKDQGYLGIIGNIRDLSEDYHKELDILEKSFNVDDAPRFESLEWKLLFDKQKEFELIFEGKFPFILTGDLEKMINRYISISYVAKFISESKENLQNVRKKIMDIYLNNPKLKNVTMYTDPHHQLVSIYKSKIIRPENRI